MSDGSSGRRTPGHADDAAPATGGARPRLDWQVDLRQVLDDLQFFAVVLDLDGRVTFVNRAVAAALGWSPEELVGRDWFATCVPPDQADAVRTSFLAKVGVGAIHRLDENHVQTRAGVRRLVEWSNSTLRNAAGEIVGSASVGLDVTDQRDLEARLRRDARTDPATGLANRLHLMVRLAAAVERGRADDDYHYALLFVDLDRFKVVNDSLGPAAGDELLLAVAGRLATLVGEPDLAARLGADEFCLLLEGAGHERAAELARAVQASFASPVALATGEVFVTGSIGIAPKALSHAAPEDVLRDATSALHRAKALGSNRWEFFKPTMRAGAVQRLRLENDLRRALARGELSLAYQPIVAIADGSLVGLEALVRWQQPERGPVAPSEFIPIAEETGLIVPIGEWILGESCAQLAAWAAQSEAARHLVVNVNVSGRQLGPELLAQVDHALRAASLPPQNLKLEITESVIMDSPTSAAELLRRIKQRGVRVCVDDFGTGYSSLSQLVRLPIDTLKIDRAFVVAMTNDPHTAEVVGSIVALGQSLRLEVVAEGVETEAQRAALARLGCGFAQGYLFSRPLDAEQVAALLREARPAR
jgi:diguanylate cyclase (GGDEF)-like protein/PAS domain S-box-containing protein